MIDPRLVPNTGKLPSIVSWFGLDYRATGMDCFNNSPCEYTVRVRIRAQVVFGGEGEFPGMVYESWGGKVFPGKAPRMACGHGRELPECGTELVRQPICNRVLMRCS